MMDLPPLDSDCHPPFWARANRRLLRAWVDDWAQEHWADAIDRVVGAYLDVLAYWARENIARLTREFESHSRLLLTQLPQPPDPDGAGNGTIAGATRDQRGST